VAGALAAALLTTATAHAAPGNRASEAQSEHDAVAAEVAAISARVTEAEQTLQRLTIEAEAASGEALAAQAALAAAQQEANTTATQLAEARGAVEATRDDVSTIGREAYMGGDDTFGDVAILLASGYSRGKALMLNVVSGGAGILGALVAFVAVQVVPSIRPYVLAMSAASLLYIAMSDLIPDLHRGEIDRNAARQVILIAAGIGTIVVFERLIG